MILCWLLYQRHARGEYLCKTNKKFSKSGRQRYDDPCGSLCGLVSALSSDIQTPEEIVILSHLIKGNRPAAEQIEQYYDADSVKTDGAAFDVWYEHVMERNAASGELETVCEEYVFNLYDSEGKAYEAFP